MLANPYRKNCIGSGIIEIILESGKLPSKNLDSVRKDHLEKIQTQKEAIQSTNNMIGKFSDNNVKQQDTNIVQANSKPPRMRIGTDEFYDLVINSDVFVDKSLMIQALLEENAKVILITRPRRWGKSLNMDMLKKFFEIEVDASGKPLPEEQKINNKLFLGGSVDIGFDETANLKALKIADVASAMKRQGQFPVISINFKDVKGSDYQKIEAEIKLQIIKLYERYRYLEQYLQKDAKLLSNPQKIQLTKYFNGEMHALDIETSLAFLSELLFKHFQQKTYLLIDEYDTPINTAYLEFGNRSDEFKKILKLFRGMFGSSLKSNPYLEKGVITGILRVAKANLFSDLNNVTEYTLLDEDFSKFYGFTQAEVEELLTKVPTTTEPGQIKDWYNGYTFGDEIIYNPWSIMQCLAHKGKLDYYWLDSGGTGLVDKALLSDEMQKDIQNLAAGKAIISPITKQISFADIDKPVGLFSLLLFSGYLNPMAHKAEENIYQLSVPNKEIRYIYNARMLQWVTDQLHIDSARYYSFVSLLPSGQLEAFKEKLQHLLLNATSFHQTGTARAELFYSGFMLGLMNTLASSYIIESERETGSGRADMVLLPKMSKDANAIIIEYKIAKTAEDLESIARAGLQQIITKQYDTKIKEHKQVQNIIKLSMAFCGKEVALAYQIDRCKS